MPTYVLPGRSRVMALVFGDAKKKPVAPGPRETLVSETPSAAPAKKRPAAKKRAAMKTAKPAKKAKRPR